MESQIIQLVTLAGDGQEISILNLLLAASLVVKLVLLILLGASMVCWWIILSKWRELNAASKHTHSFLELFWSTPQIQLAYERSDEFKQSPVVLCFQKAYVELGKVREARVRHGGEIAGDIDNIHHALKREQGVQMAPWR